MKKIGLVSLVVIGSTFFSVGASASSVYSSSNKIWNKSPWVTMTKNVKIIKIKNVDPTYKSYSVKYLVAKKGSHYRMDHWGTDYSWVLQSGKFNSGHKYTYIVSEHGHKWFKFGK